MRVIGTRSDSGDWQWSTDERQLIGTEHCLMAMPDVSNEHYLELVGATQKRVNEIFETYVDIGPL